jgi:hypothetical protein
MSLFIQIELKIKLKYSVVLKVCDELDKANALHEYYKKRLTSHIQSSIIPSLKDKDDETLLKIYIKEWKDYTIFVHFLRKMFNYLVSRLSRINQRPSALIFPFQTFSL